MLTGSMAKSSRVSSGGVSLFGMPGSRSGCSSEALDGCLGSTSTGPTGLEDLDLWACLFFIGWLNRFFPDCCL